MHCYCERSLIVIMYLLEFRTDQQHDAQKVKYGCSFFNYSLDTTLADHNGTDV